ncbi:MAG: hypothetical protein ABR582_15740 [Gemmatimonadaceae bacterium]
MPPLTRITRVLTVLMLTLASTTALHAQATQAAAPNAGLNQRDIAGLYQMMDPRGYADPLTAATYIRLLPDGRSRLEGVIVSDAGGSITARAEIGEFNRSPWSVRRTDVGPELCLSLAGKIECLQVERDLATGDLLLYDAARPRGHADLRLHRADPAAPRVGSTLP